MALCSESSLTGCHWALQSAAALSDLCFINFLDSAAFTFSPNNFGKKDLQFLSLDLRVEEQSETTFEFVVPGMSLSLIN